MTVDEWIETDGMNLEEAAEIAVECGISPLAVLHHIASVSREEVQKRSKA